jgi:uncharacterized protein
LLERFIADVMLGRLARWLRIAGYDTLYDTSWNDAYLVRLARADDRALITRDHELAKRQGVYIINLASERLNEQLDQLQNDLSLHFRKPSRCPKCNSPLLPITRMEAWYEVPLYVYIENTEFSRCVHCRRYYWPGTQWRRIREVLGKSLS